MDPGVALRLRMSSTPAFREDLLAGDIVRDDGRALLLFWFEPRAGSSGSSNDGVAGGSLVPVDCCDEMVERVTGGVYDDISETCSVSG